MPRDLRPSDDPAPSKINASHRANAGTLISKRQVNAFRKWLVSAGAVVLPNEKNEILRFRHDRGLAIIYRPNIKGYQSFVDGAWLAFDAFKRRKPAPAWLRPEPREEAAPRRAFDLTDTDRLLAFVYERRRVTVADVCSQVRVRCDFVAKRLAVLNREGRLVVSGGEPGNALWFGCA